MQRQEADVRRRIAQVLESQKLAVLATQRNGQPYSSLMAFAHTPDLARIVVATGRATRKHMNLLEEPRVSLLIDTRSNTEMDFHAAAAVTVIGATSMVPWNSSIGRRDSATVSPPSGHPHTKTSCPSLVLIGSMTS